MILLKDISKKDIMVINGWRNDFELIHLLVAPFRYINLETDEAWFDQYMRNKSSQVRCGIWLKDQEKLIGVVNLINIDNVSRNAEFSIMIGDQDYHNKGIGTLATQLILNHAFVHLNLHRIHLTVLDYNFPAIRLYEKVGFQKEGVLREAIFKDGEYRNVIQFSILKKDFLKGI
ncbi:GNAT family N-acetyltransferase [Paenibacillus alba]|uniref:GNAT family protein n=1 Tax=Paenibacillus alba TaxID=1197127 RepID=A0ABU6GEP4_9BACL|nr:GNAT family protein [Paenibacillus alba]MEC0232688.1 GNAT family protein [Paenibacillus alba]